MRLRLLGENLIAFRVTSGKVALIQDACPHRGASFFFGRNEEEGIRCAYHGWKFDMDGNCVDQLNEPEGLEVRIESARDDVSSAWSAGGWCGRIWARARCRRRCRSSSRT